MLLEIHFGALLLTCGLLPRHTANTLAARDVPLDRFLRDRDAGVVLFVRCDYLVLATQLLSGVTALAIAPRTFAWIQG